MGRITKVVLYIAAICILVTGYTFWRSLSDNLANANFNPVFVISKDIAAGADMDQIFTCQGLNINPQISFGNLPDGTKSVALEMTDTNFFAVGYAHWFLWGISPNITSIPQRVHPDFAYQGLNYYDKVGYSGPCPTNGVHHYRFTVYALDTELDLPSGSNYQSFQEAIKKHILGYGFTTATYEHKK